MQLKTFITFVTIACFSFLYTMQSYAQTRVLKRPNEYVFPYEDVDPLAHSNNDKGKLWIVFPLNQGEVTASTAGGSDNKATLDFMDSFYVINESGDHIEIAKGDLQGFNLENAESYGWINKKKMLLWSECYLTKNNLTKKVLLLNNTDQLSSSAQIGKVQKSSIEFFNNSNLTGNSIGDYKLFNILYLFSKEGDKYLVGKKEKMEAEGIDAAKNIILGWVDKSKVTAWDTRVAIEPNWHPLAAKERREKNIDLQIYDQKQSAAAYKNGQNVDQAHVFVSITDQYEQRKLGDVWRYPIIGQFDEEGLIKVGAMGRISNETGFISEEVNAKARRKFNKGMDSKKNINIVFVIDGTWGMRTYYQPVANAIREANDKLKGSGSSIKYGAVFYKDKGAHKVTDVVRLSSDPEEVVNFIDFYPGDFEDLDEAEAVYKGLEAGIKGTGLSTKETNYIVLVGNTQNHWRDDETQVPQEDLIELINKYSCHLVAIQVENKPQEDYDEFIYQFQDIIQAAAETQYTRYKNADANRKVAPPRFGETVTKVEGMDKYELSHTASIGVLITPKSGQVLEGKVLESEVYNIIIGASKKVSELINRLEMLAFGGGSKNSEVEDYMPAILDFIKTSAELTQEELNSISFDNFQGSKEGYAVIKPETSSFKLFESVLFLSIKELGDLNAQFEALYFSAKNENYFEQRQALYDTWIEILQAYEGGDEDVLAEMTMGEINEKVFGLPNKSSILADVKLKYIKDESVIGDDKFQGYADAISRKAKEIKKIYNDPYYKTSFTNNGIRYFWLPEELLP